MRERVPDVEMGEKTAERWARVVGSEGLLAAWVSASLLLMGNALIFFHMAKVHSLEIAPALAAGLALALIAGSALLVVGSTFSYASRSARSIEALPPAAQNSERRTAGFVFVFSTVMCVVICAIGLVMMRGSLSPLLKWATGQRSGTKNLVRLDLESRASAARGRGPAPPEAPVVAAPDLSVSGS